MSTSPHAPSDQRLEAACRQAGVACTVQRRAVYRALLEQDGHPSAEDIARDVWLQLPGVSLATIYRNLETLVVLGVAERVAHPDSRARFDARVDSHHHLLCISCRRLWDFDSKSVPKMRKPSAARGFHVEDVTFLIRGTCQTCFEQLGGRKKTARQQRKESR